MSDTFRAFVALELPESIRASIGAAQKALQSYGFLVKWVRPENIHLTLKFLGNIDANRTDAVVNAMTLAARGRAALHLNASGIGVFPNARRPRVIWIGLGGQVDHLKSLQQTLDAHLADSGFSAEKRPFKGHLTLGRVKGKIAAERMQSALDEFNAFESNGFATNRIILFKSELHPTGAIYTQVAHVGFW
ncbi:MAG: RNA 2',3'-cyclic phosphodiesterase [Desulfobacterales bacterium]|jgi:2'-5' RNA ligase